MNQNSLSHQNYNRAAGEEINEATNVGHMDVKYQPREDGWQRLVAKPSSFKSEVIVPTEPVLCGAAILTGNS